MAEKVTPEVTISCITYNHAKIIRKTLEGFVMQKTNFPFKILVHDDCSTDGTTEILKEYEAKYPELFDIIYEEENQYQQGNSLRKIMRPHYEGRYLASCEGDDYWIDENKLQKQYDFLEANPDTYLCVHAAYEDDLSSGLKTKRPVEKTKDQFLDMDDLIMSGGGHYPTCSFFRRYSPDIPMNIWVKGVGDYNTILQNGILGKVYYMNDIMAVKTNFLEGSWSSRHRDKSLMEKHLNNAIEGIKFFNEDTNKKYDAIIQKKVCDYKYKIECELKGNYKLLFKDPYYKPVLNSFSKTKKIRCFLLAYLKPVYKIVKPLKDIIIKIKTKVKG